MDLHDPKQPTRPEHLDDTARPHPGEALMIRRCIACGLRLAPVVRTCTACRSTALEWVMSCGQGSIVSWKVVHRPANGAGEWEASTIAIVELDDGPWIYTTLAGEVPPPSDRPVRVKFAPEAIPDKFPVFVTIAADPAPAAPSPRRQIDHSNQRRAKKSMTEPTRERPGDPIWVRSCLHQCDFLATSSSLDADARTLIRFAIEWAPFGGASGEELLVRFGITRWRFVQAIRENLRPRVSDTSTARTFKRNLLDALSWGWQIYPDSASP